MSVQEQDQSSVTRSYRSGFGRPEGKRQNRPEQAGDGIPQKPLQGKAIRQTSRQVDESRQNQPPDGDRILFPVPFRVRGCHEQNDSDPEDKPPLKCGADARGDRNREHSAWFEGCARRSRYELEEAKTLIFELDVWYYNS